MERALLPATQIHPTIQPRVANYYRAAVDEVMEAIATHDVVVVGMRQNPHPRQAAQALTAASIPFHTLTYGSYFSDWRRRLALKMWSGWGTFPMVFVKGVLIGGASDLKARISDGTVRSLLDDKTLSRAA